MTKKFFLLLILISALIIFWQIINSPLKKNGLDIKFTVNQGQSVKQTAENLKAQGLIRSVNLFKYYIWKNKSKVIAGDYILNSSMKTDKIVGILTAGETLDEEKKITLIEGWNIDDINNYLKVNNIINDTSFISLTKTALNKWPFDFIKPDFLADSPDNAALEGFLFPDTYRIFNDATSPEIIKKILFNFGEKLNGDLRAEIKKQNKSIFEIITMASLIEKEVRTEKDMKIVSGIFWDRLKYGIPLQSDATLSYILHNKKSVHSYEELQTNSPYNTYKYRGLPPGPIANPGLNSIKAAIYPTFTDYNYFLSRPDTGDTVYSVTLDEHNSNKAKYLK